LDDKPVWMHNNRFITFDNSYMKTDIGIHTIIERVPLQRRKLSFYLTAEGHIK